MNERSPSESPRHRILIVDDNPAIHEDIRKILESPSDQHSALVAAEAELFGSGPAEPAMPNFQIDSAFGGEAALEMVRASLDSDQPYAMAFVDMRMPPGWDGLETIERLWEATAELQVVICTAYSDHSFADITRRLRPQDDLLVLRKPFDSVEIRQFAHALCTKWVNRRKVMSQIRAAEVGLLESEHDQLMRGLATDMATMKAAEPMETTREDLQLVQSRVDQLWELMEAQQRALEALTESYSEPLPAPVRDGRAALGDAAVEIRSALARIFRNTLAVKAVVRSVRTIVHHKPAANDSR
jgi:two-component system NtrC family sensor kinase